VTARRGIACPICLEVSPWRDDTPSLNSNEQVLAACNLDLGLGLNV
jgi:hypothetical protein